MEYVPSFTPKKWIKLAQLRYPLRKVYITIERSTLLFMGKSTISTGPWLPVRFLYVYQRLFITKKIPMTHLDVVQRCRTTALWHSQAFTVPGEEDLSIGLL
jgi:hypothetical protein